MVKDYRNIILEYTSKDKFYCGDKTCSAFIPAEKVRHDEGVCTKCGKSTCHKCRALAHPGKQLICPILT